LLVPGQSDYELIPLGNDKFSIKILNGFFVQFGPAWRWQNSRGYFCATNGNFKALK
jgi:hypothetical protein